MTNLSEYAVPLSMVRDEFTRHNQFTYNDLPHSLTEPALNSDLFYTLNLLLKKNRLTANIQPLFPDESLDVLTVDQAEAILCLSPDSIQVLVGKLPRNTKLPHGIERAEISGSPLLVLTEKILSKKGKKNTNRESLRTVFNLWAITDDGSILFIDCR